MKKYLILVLAIIVATYAEAKVTLPALFSNNMILQQQCNAPIWGQSTAKSVTVTTSWNSKSVKSSVDASGNWRATIATPSYGGPYTITINDGSKTVIENVMIGEVWIASGQSNMEMPMAGFVSQPVEGANRDIATSKDSYMRVMTIEKVAESEPSNKVNSSGWQEATSESISTTSATAYYFARMLRAALDIPVGILVTSWGGTPINSWMSVENASKYEDCAKRDRNMAATQPSRSGVLFNGMINPIVGYAAKGFLWYQGESDRGSYKLYENKMVDLVSEWRTLWGDEQMAFYYAQIAPFEYDYRNSNTYCVSMYIREAQLKASTMIAGSGMAVLSDAGDKNCIHPTKKSIAGERLAYQALKKSYGLNGIEADGPIFNSMEIEGGEVTITFDNAANGLSATNGKLQDFEIASENGLFVEADAYIKGGKVVVSSPKVKNPAHVRYGFKDWFIGSLYNTQGIPASSFRTDSEQSTEVQQINKECN